MFNFPMNTKHSSRLARGAGKIASLESILRGWSGPGVPGGIPPSGLEAGGLKCAAYVPDGIDMSEPDSMAGLPPPGKSRRRAGAAGRGHERTDFPFLVRIISHAALGEKCEEGICIDISYTGVAFMTEADLNPIDVFELVFELNGRPALRRYARLLYRSGPRYGAYFTNLD